MKKVLFMFMALGLFTFASCESATENQAEEAADRVEESTENTADQIEEAGERQADQIEESAENMGDTTAVMQ